MSTKQSIWYGESDGKVVHIYFELAERTLQNGRMIGAPIYVDAFAIDTAPDKEARIRLTKEMGQALKAVFNLGNMEIL